jgi:hypothetical protein
MSGSYYHFVSAVRQGLAANIDSQAAGARVTVPIHVHAHARKKGSGELTQPDPIQRNIQLYGPGDVIGFDARIIVRTDPKPNTSTFEPNYFPAVEFIDVDFAWRLTADKGLDRGLKSWITLIVLRTGEGDEGEFEELAPSPTQTPVIRVMQDLLPDLEQSWRWAHAQVTSGTDSLTNDEVANFNETAPQQCVCRLLCPRRLLPRTAYSAFIVPSFELGRLAGLDQIEAMANVNAMAPAWNVQLSEEIDLPYYYRWEFHTSARGDFEYLVRLLEPRVLTQLGLRDMDCRSPGFGLSLERSDVEDENLKHVLQREGALQSFGAKYTQWGRDRDAEEPFQSQLAGLLQRANANEPELENLFQLEDTPLSELDFSLLEDAETLQVLWLTDTSSQGRFEYRPADGNHEPTVAVAGSSDDGKRHTADVTLIPERPYIFRIVVVSENGGVFTTAEARILVPLPVVVPPIYGRWHAARGEVTPNGGSWLDTLNLDPRHRAAAGEGAEVVRRDQEPLMTSAWEQLGAIETANSVLRQAKFGRQVSGNLHRRIKEMALDKFMQVTEPVQARTVIRDAEQTVAAQLYKNTNVRNVAVGPAFRRISRQRGPIRKRQGMRTASGVMLKSLASGTLQAAGRHPVPRGTPNLTDVTRKMYKQHIDSTDLPSEAARFTDAGMIPELVQSAVPFELSHLLQQAELEKVAERMPGLVKAVRAMEKIPGPAPISKLKGALAGAIEPSMTIRDRTKNRLRFRPEFENRFNGNARNDPLDEIIAHPEFPQAMYEPLLAISQQLILPGVDTVPQNSVAVVQTNRRFIESYMAGLNHEFAGELLWRRYPTDQRGSFFRQFWDVSEYVPAKNEIDANGDLLGSVRTKLEDIRALHLWGDVPLGDHAVADEKGENNLVLLIRGDLLTRYPNAVIYTVDAKRVGDELVPLLAEYGDAEKVQFPTFRGSLGSDLVFLGFPFAEARSSATSPGKFFVIEERVAEARFGLDVAPSSGGVGQGTEIHLDRWDQLSWEHVSLAGPEHAGAYLDMFDGTISCTGEGPDTWDETTSSAERARITLQKPVRIVIHADQLIPQRHEQPATQHLERIVIYDNADPDYQTPPFTDRLAVFTYDSTQPGTYKTEHELAEFNTSETIGGNRYLSISPDGTHIAIVELIGGVVRVFNRSLTPVISVGTGVNAVALTNTAIYTLGKNGLQRWGYDGRLEMTSTDYPNGFELAVDEANDRLWSTAYQVLRLGRLSDFSLLKSIAFPWHIPSVDIAPDDTVWVVSRNRGMGGTIHHLDISGTELESPFDLSPKIPYNIRVDRISSDVWVAHSGGVLRIRASDGGHDDIPVGPCFGVAPQEGGGGAWFVRLNDGGWGHITAGSLAADETFSDLGSSQKWIAVLPNFNN